MSRQRVLEALIASALFVGCSAQTSAATADDCGPEDDVERGLHTAGEGVEAGAETGAAGVKQFGKAVGGFFTDGSEGAEREWNEGKSETKAEAHEGSDEVSTVASSKHCQK